jgi:hypothetical protein
MNVMPCSHRRIPFLILPFFFLALAGCTGGSGGLQNKQSANITVLISSTSVIVGQPVTLEAYVNPSLATGTVTFYNGSNAIGSAAINSFGASTTGIALLTTIFSSSGPQSITAQYSGNAFYSATTSAVATITVDSNHLSPSSISLQASTTTPQYQTPVTLTATVSPSSVTGTVSFYNGGTLVGSAPVNGSAVTLTTSFAAGGTATVRAVYSGDYNYLSNTSTPLTINVSGPLATTTYLTSSTTGIAIGGSVTLTARLTPATTTGTVMFYNGSTAIGTATVVAGIATLSPTFSTSGNLSLTAGFNANTSWEGSSSNRVSLLVFGNTPDTVALQGAPSSVIIGDPVTLTVIVSPAAATGYVTLYEGATSISSTNLLQGSATFINEHLDPGVQTLTAVYTGDPTYTSSTSSPIIVNVTTPGSTPDTTALTLSESSGTIGDSVTLTAYVNPPTATGRVNFYDSGSLLQGVAVSSGTAAWSQVFAQSGDHSITAVYSGDASYSSSTSVPQLLELSDPPAQPAPSCPTDPTLCAIFCPGDPTCP